MSIVLLLGAGFSYSISPDFMPLTKDLVLSVRREDSNPHELAQIPKLRDGQDLERWLSTLAEPQPYLDEHDNAANAARFVIATRQIRDTILHGEHRAMADGPVPEWLNKLVRFMHVGGHTAITLNYDTLLERALVDVLRGEPSLADCVPYYRAERIKEIPPMRSSSAPSDLATALPTFQLIKLHGSLDAWWVPGDVSGETICREVPKTWGEDSSMAGDREAQPAGKQPFIVPPASAKSAYYANPISRALWRDARESLLGAERVYIVGYSLPLTDLTIANLIHDSLGHLGNTSASIEVVDVAPALVAEHLLEVGIPGERVTQHRVEAAGLVPWVDQLVDGIDLEIYPPA